MARGVIIGYDFIIRVLLGCQALNCAFFQYVKNVKFIGSFCVIKALARAFCLIQNQKQSYVIITQIFLKSRANF